MPKRYSRQFRKMVAELICVQKEGTIRTAEEFGVPLKTVENWVTAYNKDPHCFDDDYISTEQQLEAARKTIRKQKETIEILKKYTEPVSQEGLNYRDAVSMVILTRRSQEPGAMRVCL